MEQDFPQIPALSQKGTGRLRAGGGAWNLNGIRISGTRSTHGASIAALTAGRKAGRYNTTVAWLLLGWTAVDCDQL